MRMQEIKSDPPAGTCANPMRAPAVGPPAAHAAARFGNRVALSVAEFSAAFGHHRSWGYRLLYSGRIRRIDLPGPALIPISEVERLTNQLVDHGEAK